MRVSFQVPASRATLTAALEGLVAVDFVLLSKGDYPPLYSTSVRYEREPRGKEEWLTVPEVLARGVGDCEDLAAWRVAELRQAGIPAMGWVVRTGPRRFHAVVRLPSGTIEDPSRRLGMRGRA